MSLRFSPKASQVDSLYKDAICVVDKGSGKAADREEVWVEAISMDSREVFEEVGIYTAEAVEEGI